MRRRLSSRRRPCYSPSVGVTSLEDRLRVDPRSGGRDARPSSSDDVFDRWMGGSVDEHAAQILLQRLAGAGSARGQLIAHAVGNVSNGDHDTHAVRVAALQSKCSSLLLSYLTMVSVSPDSAVSEKCSRPVWQAYESVFDDYSSYAIWLEGMCGPRCSRDGFRLARALDGDDLVGFAWGYTGRRGQWWTDQARTVLDPEVADVWLNGHFELVSIEVVGRVRGRGTGRGLLRTLLGGLTHERFLLMTTPDETAPARRLYASDGCWSSARASVTALSSWAGTNRVRRRATTRPGRRST